MMMMMIEDDDEEDKAMFNNVYRFYFPPPSFSGLNLFNHSEGVIRSMRMAKVKSNCEIEIMKPIIGTKLMVQTR